MNTLSSVLHLQLCSWHQKTNKELAIFIGTKTISVFSREYKNSCAEINVKILHNCGHLYPSLAFHDSYDFLCSSSFY